MKNIIELLAAWALIHESADEGWKSAVKRGRDQTPGTMRDGPEAFVEGLAVLVDEEKERLKQRLAEGGDSDETFNQDEVGERIDQLAFEIAELRGRLESLQASIDGLAQRLPD